MSHTMEIKIDINQLPKQFCESVFAGHGQENFTLVLFTGGNPIAFALTPQHMKRLVQSLEHQLEEYERKFGMIDAKWSPGIESPIQSTDLKGKK